MAVTTENCPSCAAPLEIPSNVNRVKCPYCATPIAVQRDGSDVALSIASALSSSIEQSGSQTQAAIKEGSYVTQTELRRLQITQDLSMAQMRLASIQGEIRSLERLAATPVTRKQLVELRATERDIQRQIRTLTEALNPSLASSSSEPLDTQTETKPRGRFAWLLFSTNGRASRSQYWLGAIILFFLLLIIGITAPTTPDATSGEPTASANFFSVVLMLLFLWIGFAVSAKRYHDRNKAAWWVFIVFVPVIGFVWQLIELGFLPGTPGPNKYS